MPRIERALRGFLLTAYVLECRYKLTLPLFTVWVNVIKEESAAAIYDAIRLGTLTLATGCPQVRLLIRVKQRYRQHLTPKSMNIITLFRVAMAPANSLAIWLRTTEQ